MAKYLILEAKQNNWGYSPDTERPLCLTDDCSKYGYGYAVYKVQEDNTLEFIKSRYTVLEEGFALCCVELGYENYEDFEKRRKIIKKYVNVKKEDFTEDMAFEILKYIPINKDGYYAEKHPLHSIHTYGTFSGKNKEDNKIYYFCSYQDEVFDDANIFHKYWND